MQTQARNRQLPRQRQKFFNGACNCCDCLCSQSCTQCTGQRPRRWRFTLSGVANRAGITTASQDDNGNDCTCTQGALGPPTLIECGLANGSYQVSCCLSSTNCQWLQRFHTGANYGEIDPEYERINQCTPIAGNNFGNPTGYGYFFNLSYSVGHGWYLTLPGAIYKYSPGVAIDCMADMTLTRSYDLGFATNTCCDWPATITLTPIA